MALQFKRLFVLWLVAACLAGEVTVGTTTGTKAGTGEGTSEGTTAGTTTGTGEVTPEGTTAGTTTGTGEVTPEGTTAGTTTGTGEVTPEGTTAGTTTGTGEVTPEGTTAGTTTGTGEVTPEGTTAGTTTGTTVVTPEGTTAGTTTGTTVVTPEGTTAGTTTGTTVGTPEGTTAGTTTGTTVVTPEGTTAGTTTGTTVVTPEGTTAGTTTGTTVVTPEGTTAGTTAGTTVVTPEGTTAGTTAGTTVVKPEGTTAGTTAGTTVVTPEGTTAGTTAGTTVVTPEGTTEGTTAGTTAGTTVGTTEGGSVVPSTAPEPSPTPSDPCRPNQCKRGSTCQPRANQTFVCLCLPGDFYNDDIKSCENAKVFPGYLQLPETIYNETMNDTKSKDFLETSQKIVDTLSHAFENTTDYAGSIVLKLGPTTRTNVRSRSVIGVSATMEIIFKANASIETADVLKTVEDYIEKKCDGCPLSDATFTEERLCNMGACDTQTTECISKDGSFNCSCLDGYFETNFSSRMCMACPSGQKAVDSKCVPCPTGYSGLNCNDPWKLVVIIIGTILGALLLITGILLPIMACRSTKKSSQNDKFADKVPLVNNSVANSQAAWADSFTKPGVPRIPRAAATSSWDSRTNLEMTQSNGQQKPLPIRMQLYEDQDDMAPYTPAKSGLSGQTGAQINPYAQNQSQMNSYASSQGQTNPYYMHDNGRRFN